MNKNDYVLKPTMQESQCLILQMNNFSNRKTYEDR
jgi:hypothetical protein